MTFFAPVLPLIKKINSSSTKEKDIIQDVQDYQDSDFIIS